MPAHCPGTGCSQLSISDEPFGNVVVWGAGGSAHTALRWKESNTHVECDDSLRELTVGDALDLAAATWGPGTALVEAGPGSTQRRWTFDQLHHDAHRVARAMLERFRPGEHVAVWASNCPEWVLLEMGAAYAGLTS